MMNNKIALEEVEKITNEYNNAYTETIKLFLNAVTGKFVENVDLYEDNVFAINKTKFVKDLPVKEIKTFKQQQIEKNMRNYVQHIG